jgi:hypothetical protein
MLEGHVKVRKSLSFDFHWYLLLPCSSENKVGLREHCSPWTPVCLLFQYTRNLRPWNQDWVKVLGGWMAETSNGEQFVLAMSCLCLWKMFPLQLQPWRAGRVTPCARVLDWSAATHWVPAQVPRVCRPGPVPGVDGSHASARLSTHCGPRALVHPLSVGVCGAGSRSGLIHLYHWGIILLKPQFCSRVRASSQAFGNILIFSSQTLCILIKLLLFMNRLHIEGTLSLLSRFYCPLGYHVFWLCLWWLFPWRNHFISVDVGNVTVSSVVSGFSLSTFLSILVVLGLVLFRTIFSHPNLERTFFP